MKPAPMTADEAARLDELRGYDVLDTLPEQAYDDITLLASQICETPIAIVSLIDEDRQWFKSRLGLDATETPRDQAFCAHAILDPDALFMVEDATTDERFADNPLVTAEPRIRFYAGAPLITSRGHPLGTLCVIDRRPRQLDAGQQATLWALSRQVIAQLELRRTVGKLEQRTAELAELVRVLEEQAELIDRDLHRAEIIQRSLLPHEAPMLADFSVHTLYRPGRSIGGDLYDVVGIADRYLALVIADASGHGVSAAMLSVLFKHHLRLMDQATGIPYRPGWALERINASLLADRPAPGVFLTAAYCLLDTLERKLVVGSAGHPPLICLRAAGGVEQIDHTGPALGLDPEATYAEVELSLAEGDRLLLYTDGVSDIGASAPSVGGIATALRALDSSPDVLEQLLLRLSNGQMRPDCDDVTLVLLDAVAGESVFNESAETLDLAPLPAGDPPEMSRADTADVTFIVLKGRIVWLQGQVLFDTALAVLNAGRGLVIDLGDCVHMDSTLLGTLYELVQRAEQLGLDLHLQHVPAVVRSEFEELSMAMVLERIAQQSVAVPESLEAIDLGAVDDSRRQLRLLKAHEALVDLSEHNRGQFGDLVDGLRAELSDDDRDDRDERIERDE